MARIGYARVSRTDQDLALQIERLKAAGCEMVRSEKVTGSTRQGRSELASIIAFLRPGDELVVTRIDRLARSIGDLQDIVREMRAKGASLRATEQPSTPARLPGRRFSICSGCLRNLRRTSGASASLKGSRRRKRQAFTRAARAGLTGRLSRACTATARVRARLQRRSGFRGCTPIG